jgi:hypothetical protein
MPASLYLPKAVSGDDRVATLRAADWLCLAAAPIFAIMALLTGVRDRPTCRMHESGR